MRNDCIDLKSKFKLIDPHLQPHKKYGIMWPNLKLGRSVTDRMYQCNLKIMIFPINNDWKKRIVGKIFVSTILDTDKIWIKLWSRQLFDLGWKCGAKSI